MSTMPPDFTVPEDEWLELDTDTAESVVVQAVGGRMCVYVGAEAPAETRRGLRASSETGPLTLDLDEGDVVFLRSIESGPIKAVAWF